MNDKNEITKPNNAESKLKYSRENFNDPIKCLDFEILQLGEIYANENTSIRPHCQQCDEISFIVSGKGVFSDNSTSYNVKKGDCFLSFKDSVHQIETNINDPLHFCFVAFRSENEAVKKMIGQLKNMSRLIYLTEAEQIFADMIRESWEGKYNANEMIGCCLYELLIMLIRSENAIPQTLPDSSIVHRITVFLQSHIYEIDAISKIEKTFNYNQKLLASTFKNAMGETIHNYFQRIRMEKANQLLRSRKSVTETAYALGYSSIHPFSKAYKKHFGYSPAKNQKIK